MENKESKKAWMEKKTERRRRQHEGDETYLGMVAKEKKQRLVTMLECNEDDARVRQTRRSDAHRDGFARRRLEEEESAKA